MSRFLAVSSQVQVCAFANQFMLTLNLCLKVQTLAKLLNLPQPIGQLIALDVGSSFIGVAGCDPELRRAHPLGVMHRALPDPEKRVEVPVRKVVRSLNRIITERKAKALIVGLPVDDGGLLTQRCIEIGQIIIDLQRNGLERCPVLFEDERFSTKEASQRASKRDRLLHKDELAAVVIMERFLERLWECSTASP